MDFKVLLSIDGYLNVTLNSQEDLFWNSLLFRPGIERQRGIPSWINSRLALGYLSWEEAAPGLCGPYGFQGIFLTWDSQMLTRTATRLVPLDRKSCETANSSVCLAVLGQRPASPRVASARSPPASHPSHCIWGAPSVPPTWPWHPASKPFKCFLTVLCEIHISNDGI